MQPTLVFLENPMDRGAWRATVHRVRSDLVCTHLSGKEKQRYQCCSIKVDMLELMKNEGKSNMNSELKKCWRNIQKQN